MDKSLKTIVIFFAFLALICFLVGWVIPGFMMFTIAAVLINESIQEKKRKAKGEVKDEPVVQIDLGNGKVLSDEQKIARMPVSINNLKYQNEDQLNDILPKISAMYGISLAALWVAVNAAKDKMRLKQEAEDRYWKDIYAEDVERDSAIDELEPDDLDEEEREELMEDFDDDWSSHDSFDAHDTFDAHDDFGHDSWGSSDFGDYHDGGSFVR